MALKGWKSQRSENFFGIWGNKNQNIWNCLCSLIYRGLCYAAFAKKEMVDPARSLKVSFLESLCAKQGMGFSSLSKGQYISIFHVWRSDYYIFRKKFQKSKYLLNYKPNMLILIHLRLENDPKMSPKWPQNDPKMTPKWP